MSTGRYDASIEWLARAESTVPLGSQTFSKSRTAFPVGAAPLFADHGQGSRLFDIDGNEFVDLVCGLGAVTLGYRDPDVDAAVAEQLSRGITFSLATKLEAEVAERLVEMIPCAEKVRFGKNGSDATTAAVRLARAFTGRDKILVSGYHGWHDWYIGSTTRNLGVPDAVRDLTVKVPFGDLEALDRTMTELRGEVAALIMEPFGGQVPADDYLSDALALMNKHGALLIFDETVTGFRLANGGAQELYGVQPDLATFGKGMGNGLPISAVVGRTEVMDLMEEIFFSGTFGGETLSLAAAKAVLDKYRSEPVAATLGATGRSITDGVAELLSAAGANEFMFLAGRHDWSGIGMQVADESLLWELKTLFIQEMAKAGVLTLGQHQVTYAHSSEDVAVVLDAYSQTLPQLVSSYSAGTARGLLDCEPLRPLFTVR